jgi:ribosomal protein L7Ae-like RNA K-turn-binding protein
MIHVLLGPEGASGLFEIAVDASGKGSHGGRGAHVHPTPACVAAAAQRGLARSMKRGLAIDGQKLDAAGLSNAIVLSCERRIEGLLSSARRARRIALGADSVVAAGRAGEAHLVMVATDAASAAELGEVRRAIAEGRAIAWGDKARLSLAAGGAERTMGLGVVAITDDRIARAVREAAQTADALRGGATAGRAAAERRSQGADRRSGGAPSKEPSERAAHTDESDRAAIASDERSGRSGRVGEQRSEATDAGGIEPSSTADVGGQAVE